MSDSRLSAVCTLGPRRGRADRMLVALDAQTAVDSIEIVFVDAGPAGQPPKASREIPTTVIPYPPGAPPGEARAAGVRAAQSEIVAFLTDHSYPEPGWAEVVITAYRDRPWAAVGYAFRNANPDTYGSRAPMLADFGPWLVPTRSGMTGHLPPLDLSYRRSVLVGLGDEIAELLTAEPLLIEELQRRGHRLAIAAEAVVAVASLPTLRDNARLSFTYCRALAGIQVRRERWGIGRRLGHALLSAAGAPLIRTARSVRALAGKPSRSAVLLLLPGILFQHLGAGFGQAWGYVAGGGGAAGRFAGWVLDAARDDR